MKRLSALLLALLLLTGLLLPARAAAARVFDDEIGRASCRERV